MSAHEIFTEWNTYAKVVANDYMHHREFVAALAAYVRRELEPPLAVIDLGCGDTRPVLPLLREFDVSCYTGIDQSAAAIDRAGQMLAGLGVPFTLHCATLPAALENLDGPFDLAIASYSLHHLEESQKRRAVSECRRLLRPGGALAVVDVFREGGESRGAYIDRWQLHARATFQALAPIEMDALLDHVATADHPETVAAYRRLAEAAGFKEVTPLMQDRERLNRLVVIS